MRKIKDVLRLKLDADRPQRQIAAALGVSKAAVTVYLSLAAAAGLEVAICLVTPAFAVEDEFRPRHAVAVETQVIPHTFG
jgi:DNA-binding transcriptional regulator LsrR (DeoR family)